MNPSSVREQDSAVIPGEPANPSTDSHIAVRRRKNWRLALVIILILPSVLAMVVNIGYFLQRTVFFSSGWSQLLYPVFYQTYEATFAVLALQVIVWLLWAPHRRSIWLPLVWLIGALTLGRVASFYLLPSGSFPDADAFSITLYWVAQGWTYLAANLMTVLAATLVLRFWFASRLPSADRDELPSRREWTLRGLFAATLVAACVLAIFRWGRQIYAGQENLDWYPTSDLALVIWWSGALIAEVSVLFAAALRHTSHARSITYACLLAALLSSVLGHQGYMMFVPESSTLGDAFGRQVRDQATAIMVMYWLHRGAFRRWREAGYELRLATAWSG